jgi:Tat protein secretion system quality control protein TatD with DNase activity
MRWFDSHAHLQDEKFIEDIDDVLVRAGQPMSEGSFAGSDLLSVERGVLCQPISLMFSVSALEYTT